MHAGITHKLDHMFEELAAPVHEDPALIVTGEIESTLQVGLEVRDPSCRLAAHLEPRAADVQGQHGGATVRCREGTGSGSLHRG